MLKIPSGTITKKERERKVRSSCALHFDGTKDVQMPVITGPIFKNS